MITQATERVDNLDWVTSIVLFIKIFRSVYDEWHEGSFSSPQKSAEYHFLKHGAEVGANDIDQYIRKAVEFKRRRKGADKAPIRGVLQGVTRYYKNGRYIDLAPDGRIISFGET